jgi:hypothetical protein
MGLMGIVMLTSILPLWAWVNRLGFDAPHQTIPFWVMGSVIQLVAYGVLVHVLSESKCASQVVNTIHDNDSISLGKRM